MLRGKINFSIILVILVLVLIIGFFLFNSNGKQNYINYSRTQEKINVKLNNLLSTEANIEKIYYANKLDEGETVKRIKKVAKDLEHLYDSFSFNKGDIYIKELYITKKEIIIDYAELYMNRAESISKGIKPIDSDLTYITNLGIRYTALDNVLKSKYKINFAS
ncbi:MAG TPA: hypothetical protein VIK72_05795 [Clostridiaceae bacterium]